MRTKDSAWKFVFAMNPFQKWKPFSSAFRSLSLYVCLSHLLSLSPSHSLTHSIVLLFGLLLDPAPALALHTYFSRRSKLWIAAYANIASINLTHFFFIHSSRFFPLLCVALATLSICMPSSCGHFSMALPLGTFEFKCHKVFLSHRRRIKKAYILFLYDRINCPVVR